MPRPNFITDTFFYDLPPIVSGYQLPNCLSIVVPCGEDRINLITQPSLETSTNWTSTGGIESISSSVYSYFGSFSWVLKYNDGVSIGLTPGVYYGGTTPLSLTSGSTYAVSMRFMNPTAGRPYDFYIATTAGVRLGGTKFKSNGFWQYIWFLYTETSTASRRLYVVATDTVRQPVSVSALSNAGYIDAVQVELCGSGKNYPTTYIDGSRKGLTPGEFPNPYYWNGTPDNSTSTRTRFTRSGGRVVNFRDLGMTISDINGLGLITPNTTSQKLSRLDGERYQFTQKGARPFSVSGRVQGRSVVLLDNAFSALSSVMDIDSSSRQEPFILKYLPMDEEENQIGPELDIIATYEGGLEGRRNNLNVETFSINFKQYSPNLFGHEESGGAGGGGTISTSASVSNANGIIRKTNERISSGFWRALSTGVSGGSAVVFAIAVGLDGTIYIGGDFTDAGGSGADYAAAYNPSTNTFSVIKSATSFNASVLAIAIGPNGDIYFGGSFTNVDGIAAADGIVKYTPSTNTFAALGTGVSAGTSVYALKFDYTGNLYAGGDFALMGGVANTVRIAKWNGSAWSALGTGALNNVVLSIALSGLTVYAGGSFTQMGGIANTARIAYYDTAWHSIGGTGADDNIYALALGIDGYIYIGGVFENIGGIAARKLVRWNGTSIQTVVSATSFDTGVDKYIRSIFPSPDGTLYICGKFTNVNGIVYPQGLAKYDGSNLLPISVILPGTVDARSIFIDSSGSLYIGFDTSGTATAEISNDGVAAVGNGALVSGTAKTYPKIKITALASLRLYSIRNLSTGKDVYFNLSIQNGDIIYMDFDPNNLSFVSAFSGNISPFIIKGSSEAELYLINGQNDFAVLMTGNNTTNMTWVQQFLSMSDAVGKR